MDVTALQVVVPTLFPPKDTVMEWVPTARLLEATVAVPVLLQVALPIADPLSENIATAFDAQDSGVMDPVKVTLFP